MTHDWPSGIADPSTLAKEYVRCCRSLALGNNPCRLLLEELHPSLMLCGHMHQVYTAVIGPSTVQCLAKVPAPGSVTFFEVLDVDGSPVPNNVTDEGRLQIRELGWV